MRRAILIGNGAYDSDLLQDLPSPANDLRALEQVLRDPRLGGYTKVDPRLNQPVAALRPLIQRTLRDAEPDDTLLLYFSGHGIRRADQGGAKLFLAVKDTERELEDTTAIRAEEIVNFMVACRAREQLLLLDCCYSGQLLDDILRSKSATGSGTEALQRQLEQADDGDDGRFIGILTATHRFQEAYADQGRPSAFTDAIVQGISRGEADTNQDGSITFTELRDHVKRMLRRSPQTPEAFVRGGADMVVARTATGRAVTSVGEREGRKSSAARRSRHELGVFNRLVTPFPPPAVEHAVPMDIGVFQPSWAGGEPLPYVRRQGVDRDLARAIADHHMVVAIGPAAAGKARSLHEAAREALAGHHLLRPETPSLLAMVIGALVDATRPTPTILWLPHLERYLVPGRLDVQTIEALWNRRPDVRILATLTSSQHDRLVDAPVPAEIRQPYSGVLAHPDVGPVRVPDELEQGQLQELPPVYRDRDLSVTLGPDIVGAKELLRRWGNLQDEHPLAAAVVQAAVDWRRMGMERAASDEDLRALVARHHGLDRRRAPDWLAEYQEAINHAGSATSSGARLLDWVLEHPSGLVANPILIDHDELDNRPIPREHWRYARDVGGPQQALILGFSAYTRKQIEEARLAWEAAGRGPDPRAQLYLGLTLLEGPALGQHQARRALAVLQSAANAGDGVAIQAAFHLALLVLDHGEDLGLPDEERVGLVEDSLERARGAGDRGRADQLTLRLGLLHEQQGRYEAAFEALEAARAAAQPSVVTQAAFHLAVLVLDHGEHLELSDEARIRLVEDGLDQTRQAGDHAHADQLTLQLGLLQAQHRRYQEAFQLLRSARDAAEPSVATQAAFHLAVLVLDHGESLGLSDEGRVQLAHDRLQEARRSPDPVIAVGAAFRLAVLVLDHAEGLGLSEDARVQLAMACLQAVRQSPDRQIATRAAYRLAVLHHQRREYAAALQLLRAAREAPDPSTAASAALDLALLALDHGDELELSPDDAERLARTCLEQAQQGPDRQTATRAAYRLAILHKQHQEYAAALPLLRAAREAPDRSLATLAAHDLAVLMLDHGDGLVLDEEALRLADACLQEARHSADQQLAAAAAYRLALLALDHGEGQGLSEEERVRLADTCLREARQSPDDQLASLAANRLAVLALDHGEALGLSEEERVLLVEDCLRQTRQAGDRQHADQLTLRLGLLREQRQQYVAAFKLFRGARQAVEPSVATAAAFHLAVLVLDHGDDLRVAEKAGVPLARRWLEEARQSADRQVATAAAYRLAVLALDHGEHLELSEEDRNGLARACLEQAASSPDHRVASQSSLRQGVLWKRQGDVEAARRCLDAAHHSHDEEIRANAAAELGVLVADMEGREWEAITFLEQALQAGDHVAPCRVAPTLAELYLRVARLSHQQDEKAELLRRAIGALELARDECPQDLRPRAAHQLGAARVELAAVTATSSARIEQLKAALRDHLTAGLTSKHIIGVFLPWVETLRSTPPSGARSIGRPDERVRELCAKIKEVQRTLDATASLRLARSLDQLRDTGCDDLLSGMIILLSDRVDAADPGIREARRLAGMRHYALALAAGPAAQGATATADGRQRLEQGLRLSEDRLRQAIQGSVDPPPDATFTLGRILEYRRDHSGSIEQYKQARHGQPPLRWEALWRMARLAEARRDYDTARRAYRELAESEKYRPIAVRRLRMLRRWPLRYQTPEPLLWQQQMDDDVQFVWSWLNQQPQETSVSEAARNIGLGLLLFAGLELAAWLLRWPFQRVPWVGPGLRDHADELLHFAGVDASVGLLWLALSQVLLTRRIYMLATWLKVALVVLIGVTTVAIEQVAGGFTADRASALDMVFRAAVALIAIALPIYLLWMLISSGNGPTAWRVLRVIPPFAVFGVIIYLLVRYVLLTAPVRQVFDGVVQLAKSLLEAV